MTLHNYLHAKLSTASQKIYLFEIKHFIQYLGQPKADNATHQDILQYLQFLRKRYDNPKTINRILQAIKLYFFFLMESGHRDDHPCRFLSLKDQAPHQIQIQDLFKTIDLEKLLDRKERYPILATRNKVIITLLIYQALRVREICELNLNDLNLEKATIYTKGTPKTNPRTLSLKPTQIFLFYQYLNQTRPQLIQVKSDRLIITKKGTEEKGEGIQYLISTFRTYFPNKKITPTIIRQSVIANLLADGKDLRIVQAFAGHKKPTATEKYRQTSFEALKQAVNLFHPLN